MLNKLFRNFNRDALARYFKNTSWMLGEKVFRLGVTLAVGIWVTRYLGAERFGLFGYVTGFVGMFSSLPSLGMLYIFLRDLVAYPDQRNSYMGTAFWLHIGGSLTTFLLIGGIAWFQGDVPQTILLLMIGGSAYFFHTLHIIDFFFQSKVEAKVSARVLLVAVTLTNLGKLLFIWQERSLIWFVWLIPAEQLFTAIGYLVVYYWKGFSVRAWQFSKKIALDILRQSWFYILSGMAANIYLKIDQVMIKQLLGNEPNGFYAAAVRFSEAWYFIPVVICNSLIPAITHAKQKGEGFYYNRLQKLYDLVAWMAMGISVVMVFGAKPLILLTIGEEFAPSIAVLQVHIWASIFVFLGIASDRWLLQEKLYSLLIYRNAVGAVLNISLNLVLIPKFGIMAAAWTTLASYAASSYLAYLPLPSTRRTFWMQTQTLWAPVRFLKSRRN